MDEPSDIAHWRGELLWPCALVEGEIIDLTEVISLGTWTHAWFAARPGQGVAGAAPRIRVQLDRAGLDICWRDPTRIIPGVSHAERAALFNSSPSET
jgi:hypothetical protein